MTEFSPISKSEHDLPDFAFDTDQDLRAHAHGLIGGIAARLVEAEAEMAEDRPDGSSLATATVIPCQDDNDITRQVAYMGYCAEACRDNALVVREQRMERCPNTNGLYGILVISTADSLAVALAEQMAEKHPEKSGRVH